MKNQGKNKQQTPTNGPDVTNSAKKPTPSIPNENQRQSPQNVQDKNKKDELNPGGNEHHIGDLPKENSKNQGGDMDKRKDPDPTIPEKRNDPVGGKEDAYSRTLNTPGKKETNKVGEFSEVDEMDREEEEEEETSDISDEEPDEDEPGMDAGKDKKEAFGGGRKNSNTDESKDRNGL